jgi:hypothetical protein
MHTEQGHADLQMWTEAKAKALAEGQDFRAVMIELIRTQRRRYENSGRE